MDRRFPVFFLSAVQLQQPQNQFSDSYIIQRLRETLFTTINEVKLLKEENKALKDSIHQQGESERPNVTQLQKEVKLKDDLLLKAAQKEQEMTRAYIITSDLLALKEEEVKSLKEELHLKDSLLESVVKKDALASKEMEIKSLRYNLRRELACKEDLRAEMKEKVHENQANEKLEVSRLQEELKSTKELLGRAIKQRRKRTKAYLDTMDLLNKRSLELKRTEEHWRLKCNELQKSLDEQTSNLQVLQSSDI
ncbi:protein MNN4-like [Xyrichtys novacula]|uniref:Protein MNN4-like n=1 Tax=Xyrichtys novacula TaxID=13765 RepID=A0AAV1HH79_XYRNO|nr:protein MNN4-like [Xyrichtys novacula]CAJ1085401.1 protein MNN4-like [Xyrichtys novacula]